MINLCKCKYNLIFKGGFDVNSKSGDLIKWAHQGMLMLNSALTVEEGQAGAHSDEWIEFSLKLIKYIEEAFSPVWLLWGRDAHTTAEIGKHKVCTSHCSPLAAHRPSGGHPAFIGSKCFSDVNKILKQLHKPGINWQI